MAVQAEEMAIRQSHPDPVAAKLTPEDAKAKGDPKAYRRC
jgi:hypothetical protein